MIFVNNPKLETEQFKLSERILDIRYELGLDLYEMAELLNMKAEEYIDFEYGNTNISVDDYLKVIEILEEYKEKEY